MCVIWILKYSIINRMLTTIRGITSHHSRGLGGGAVRQHAHLIIPTQKMGGIRTTHVRSNALPVVGDVAELDSATAATLSLILKPTLSLYSLLMIVRIVMTWYPEVDGKTFPWSIAFKSTEGLLQGTRKVVKPFNGLDVSPIVWVALLSFFSEILTGPQGILSLIARKGI